MPSVSRSDTLFQQPPGTVVEQWVQRFRERIEASAQEWDPDPMKIGLETTPSWTTSGSVTKGRTTWSYSDFDEWLAEYSNGESRTASLRVEFSYGANLTELSFNLADYQTTVYVRGADRADILHFFVAVDRWVQEEEQRASADEAAAQVAEPEPDQATSPPWWRSWVPTSSLWVNVVGGLIVLVLLGLAVWIQSRIG